MSDDRACFDYVRFMDATWAFLQSSAEGQQQLLDELAERERQILGKAFGPSLAIELARRRKSVSRVLLPSFPVTYFAYVATEGTQGVMRFLESPAWRRRPSQPGSAFPPAATTAVAFTAFLEGTGWVERQEAWIRESFAFERAFLFGGGPRVSRRVEGRGVQLVDGAWVAEAPFEVPRYGRLLRERGQEEPWSDALYFVKPWPSPFAVISVPAGEKVRRIHLSGPAASGLRWLWDEKEEVPAGALQSAELRHAVEAGLVRLQGES
jgi:hypothetical protein